MRTLSDMCMVKSFYNKKSEHTIGGHKNRKRGKMPILGRPCACLGVASENHI